jgi:hypothetical protein
VRLDFIGDGRDGGGLLHPADAQLLLEGGRRAVAGYLRVETALEFRLSGLAETKVHRTLCQYFDI